MQLRIKMRCLQPLILLSDKCCTRTATYLNKIFTCSTSHFSKNYHWHHLTEDVFVVNVELLACYLLKWTAYMCGSDFFFHQAHTNPPSPTFVHPSAELMVLFWAQSWKLWPFEATPNFPNFSPPCSFLEQAEQASNHCFYFSFYCRLIWKW